MDKQFKKYRNFYWFLIASLILCFSISGELCFAQGVTVSIPEGLEGETGSSVEVPVNIEGDAVNQIFAGTVSFGYDAGVLDAPSVATGELLGSVTGNTSVSGQVSFSFAQAAPLSGEGILVIVTFTVVGTAGTSTELDLIEATFNEGAIIATFDDGSFTVTGGPVGGVTVSIPEGLEGETGSSVEVPVNIEGDAVNQIFAGTVSFGYDAGVLDAPSVATGELLGSVTGNTSVSGQVSFSFAQAAPLSGEGILVIVTFTVVGAAGTSTELDLTEATFNEGAIPATLNDGSFTVTDDGVVPGDVTGDGVVDVADLIRTINIILGIGPEPSEAESAAADINNDGIIDVADLIGIINLILGIG